MQLTQSDYAEDAQSGDLAEPTAKTIWLVTYIDQFAYRCGQSGEEEPVWLLEW